MLLYAACILTSVIIVTAQRDRDDGMNPTINISSCQSLACSPPDGSICSSGDLPGPEVGVGMAAQAVNSSSTSLSFTLIDGLDENGFTGIGSSEYEYSDQQLFVGMPADTRDYPSGCVLMMQYQGQTFPLEPLSDDDNRSEGSKGTTSCDGVLDVFCRASIVDMIRDFDVSGDEPRCGRLIEHVNSKLRGSSGTCGGEGAWIANFFNVTGGTLPRSNSTVASASRLGSEECRPVTPESYELFLVARMRQLYFAEPPSSASDYLGRLYGGRAGWTPVMAVVYGEEESDDVPDPDVSFLCMETLKRDGEKRDSSLDSGGSQIPASAMLSAITLLLASLSRIL
ncbi:hypothetical protein ACHAQH_006586 [Verticillium albo-atrum]